MLQYQKPKSVGLSKIKKNTFRSLNIGSTHRLFFTVKGHKVVYFIRSLH